MLEPDILPQPSAQLVEVGGNTWVAWRDLDPERAAPQRGDILRGLQQVTFGRPDAAALRFVRRFGAIKYCSRHWTPVQFCNRRGEIDASVCRPASVSHDGDALLAAPVTNLADLAQDVRSVLRLAAAIHGNADPTEADLQRVHRLAQTSDPVAPAATRQEVVSAAVNRLLEVSNLSPVLTWHGSKQLLHLEGYPTTSTYDAVARALLLRVARAGSLALCPGCAIIFLAGRRWKWCDECGVREARRKASQRHRQKIRKVGSHTPRKG